MFGGRQGLERREGRLPGWRGVSVSKSDGKGPPSQVGLCRVWEGLLTLIPTAVESLCVWYDA